MQNIDSNFIEKHKTKNGAWTKRQLEIIGIAWPPPKGWKKSFTPIYVDEKLLKEFQNISYKSFAQTEFSGIN